MSDGNSKVRIAMVGCGGWSKVRNQGAIAQCDNLEVVACYDLDTAEAREAAEKFKARLCHSYEEVLAMAEVEAVVLTTPNQVHRAQTEAAVAAGKHVFVEKPISNNVADGLAMVRAARAADRILMVGHNTRRRQAVRLAQDYIKGGRLGQIVGCEAQFSHAGGLKLPEDSWRADPQKAPGLPLVQLGIHIIDVVNMILGRPVEVASFHRRAYLQRNTDVTVQIVSYQEPLVATVQSHYIIPLRNWCSVQGTLGVIEATEHLRKFVFRGSDGKIEEREFPEDLSYRDEFAAFGRSVRLGEPVETDGLGGVYALAVVEASIISAREHRFVRIDELVKGV